MEPLAKLASAKEWIENAEQQHLNCHKYKDSPINLNDIRNKSKEISDEVRKVMNKPVPKPEPKKEEKKEADPAQPSAEKMDVET